MYKIRYILFFVIFFLNYINSMEKSKQNSGFILIEDVKKKNFKCHFENCNYSAKCNTNLKRHILYKHTQKRNFKCNFQDCNYNAKAKRDLTRHVLRKHTQERNIKCSFKNCDYSTKIKCDLDKHILYKHTQESKFKCNFQNCNYSTKTNSALKRHMLLRHNQKKILKKELVLESESFKDFNDQENTELSLFDNRYLIEPNESILVPVKEIEKPGNDIKLYKDSEINEKNSLQDYENIPNFFQDDDLNFDF